MSTKQNFLIHVVDDESVIAWTLAAILQKHGFEATSFTNPLKALEAAMVAPPHLLLSDVSMPHMSGVELAIQMKELSSELKVILFSGQATLVDLLIDAAERGHTFEILKKPLQPADLLTAVRHASVGAEVLRG